MFFDKQSKHQQQEYLCCWDDIEKAINIYLDCINEIKWTT